MLNLSLRLCALAGLGFLVACNGSSSSSDTVPVDNNPPAPEPRSVYSFANACYSLQTEDGRVIHEDGEGYRATATATAPAFYFKPTGLGVEKAQYLLLSSYERQAAPAENGDMVTSIDEGRKTLLGISDPANAFLDQEGNFVGEPGAVIAGVGDMSDFATDAGKAFGGGDQSGALGGGLREAGGQISDGMQAGSAPEDPVLGAVNEASDLAVWLLGRASGDDELFTLQSQVTMQYLAIDSEGELGLAAEPEGDLVSTFRLTEVNGCDSYPEAELNAKLVDPQISPRIYWDEENRENVYGWVDDHAHITAYEFIGGRINYGSTHHKFGIDHALGDCEVNHGPSGSTGTVEMATSNDFDGHETRGWPSYNEWPIHNSLQHHQSYYRWMERAFLAGQKIMVNLITHNEILCQVVPQKKNACDGMTNTHLQIDRTYELQDYIDAQEGGPGKGWFRVVTTPAEARQVIDQGKMAVLLGIEMSKVFNCGEFLDRAECTEGQMRERLDEVYQRGVRLIFPVHKFDNAFGGHLPHSGFALGPILSAGNQAETGHPLEVEECPEDESGNEDFSGDPNDPRNHPEGIFEYLLANFEYLINQAPRDDNFQSFDPREGTGNLCNIRGLTGLGESLLDTLVSRGMLIDLDHISRRAATEALDFLDTNYPGFPVISSHDWMGSETLLNRIAANGGFIGRFARGGRSQWIGRLTGIAARYDGEFFGGGIASDVNGIAELPRNPWDGAEDSTGRLGYPFRSYDGRVEFDRQVTGDRVFGLNDGRGVAHYGLYPDYIADAEQFGGTEDVEAAQALNIFFRSAEAYLRMWEQVESFAGN